MNSKPNKKQPANGRRHKTTDSLKLDSKSRQFRILPMLLCAIAGAAVVIVTVIALTPLDEEPTILGTEIEPSPSLDLGATVQRVVPSHALPAESMAQAVNLDFPESAERIDVDSLKAELNDLAVLLESSYALQDPSAFHTAARIYAALQQTQLAEDSWRKSIASEDSSPGPYAGLAEILVGSGREPEAIKLISTAHNSGITSSETWLWLARAQENLGQIDDAKQTLDQAVEAFPADPEAWLARGRVLNQLREYSAAEESILRNLQLAGDSERALAVLSIALVRQKKTEPVQATRERLAALRSNTTPQAGDFQLSYNSALSAIAVDALLASAALSEKNAQLADAEKYLQRAMQLSPLDGTIYMALSKLFRSQGKIYEAFLVQKQLVKIQPDNPLNYVNLASVATQVGEVQLAKSTLLRAVELDPQGIIAQDSLIRLYVALGELDIAKQYANQVIEENRCVEAYLLLACVCEARGETTAAINAIQQGKLLDPNHPVWKLQ